MSSGTLTRQNVLPGPMRLIQAIDLSMVKKKLIDKEEGPGWSQQRADFVEVRYRRYLYMIYVARSGANVPTKDIDAFWHQHILDTRAYADDCQRVFGEFIHHFPYFGMRGEEDAALLQRSFEETSERYFELFGERYDLSDQPQDVTESSRCNKCSKCGIWYCHRSN